MTDTVGVTSYSYDALNRLSAVSYPTPSTITYTLDATGNRLSDGSTTYAYDAANRMISTTFGTTTTLMGYDGFGRLISETVGAVTTEFIADESRALPVMLGEIGASEKLFAVGGDGFAVQQIVGGSTDWALLGDIRFSLILLLHSKMYFVAS